MSSKHTRRTKSVHVPPRGNPNRDPIADAPGAHPVEVGAGAVAGGVAGGYGGKAVGEAIDPTTRARPARSARAGRSGKARSGRPKAGVRPAARKRARAGPADHGGRIQESYLVLDGEWHFVRHSAIRPGRPTLLFVHGLGESSLCFREAFDRLHALDCNLVCPDNVGYGRSSPARDGDYSFAAQVGRLRGLAAGLGLGRLTLVGHALGGALATDWAASAGDGSVDGVVNVEGGLTPADADIPRMAVEAHGACGGDLGRWCEWLREEFMDRLALRTYGADREAGRRYYASLWFCRPEAFLANAREAWEKSRPVEGTAASAVGEAYKSVGVPKVYCWGSESLSGPARRLLKDARLANRKFDGAGHWPMIDRAEEFYAFLGEWAAGRASDTRSA